MPLEDRGDVDQSGTVGGKLLRGRESAYDSGQKADGLQKASSGIRRREDRVKNDGQI